MARMRRLPVRWGAVPAGGMAQYHRRNQAYQRDIVRRRGEYSSGVLRIAQYLTSIARGFRGRGIWKPPGYNFVRKRKEGRK